MTQGHVVESAKNLIMEMLSRSGGSIEIHDGYMSKYGYMQLLNLDGHIEYEVFTKAFDSLMDSQAIELVLIDEVTTLRIKGM